MPPQIKFYPLLDLVQEHVVNICSIRNVIKSYINATFYTMILYYFNR